MSLGRLPPVGTRVRATGGGSLPEFPGFSSFYLQSGTAALAQAMLCAKSLVGDTKRASVVLPAYGCPDLVAAALFAGLKPLLIDIQPQDPAYDLDALSKVLASGEVCAVVAVNFLGIKENMLELRRLTQAAGTLLIEDSAQWFPEDYLATASLADFVLTSFGRGKPLNLLGGGLLLVPESRLSQLPELERFKPGSERAGTPSLSYKVKAGVFNQLLSPLVFGLASRLPFLGVGSTRFHALDSVEQVSPDKLSCMPSNLGAYLSQSRWREQTLCSGLQGLPGLIDLAQTLRYRKGRLLRYPVLTETQNQFAALPGASTMYQRPLVDIEGVPEALTQAGASEQAACPGAREFASHFCSLPLHEGVTAEILEGMLAQAKQIPVGTAVA